MPELVPWPAAGLAFMNRVDDVAETGTADRRAAGLEELGAEVRRALETGDSPDPLLRAYAHAVDSRGLPADWVFRSLADLADLAAADGILDLTAPGLRAVAATMTERMEHQLTAVEKAGARALRKGVGHGFTAPLRTLVRARPRRPRTAA